MCLFTVSLTHSPSPGLLSGDYSFPDTGKDEGDVILTPGIRPWMFRSLIGKGHVEFSTKRQQDAQEFLLHVIEATERNAKNGHNPCSALQVLIELSSSWTCGFLLCFFFRVPYLHLLM